MPIFTVTFTGADPNADADAALFRIDAENARRAALDPPVDPLPNGTNAEVKSSYETCLALDLDRSHASFATQAASNQSSAQNIRERWRISTRAQREAAAAELETIPPE